MVLYCQNSLRNELGEADKPTRFESVSFDRRYLVSGGFHQRAQARNDLSEVFVASIGRPICHFSSTRRQWLYSNLQDVLDSHPTRVAHSSQPSEWSPPKQTYATTAPTSHGGNGAMVEEKEAMVRDTTGQTKSTSLVLS